MKDALTRLLSSMKFWTVIVGLVTTMGATAFAKWGIDTSDAAQQQIAITISALFAILLHAQGNAESGKEAAKIQASAATPAVAVNKVDKIDIVTQEPIE